MTLQPLYNPAKGVMRVIGFMSGSGSNIRRLLEHQRELGEKVYNIVALFSDRTGSNAPQIGKEFDVPVVVRDIDAFYAKRGKLRKDLSLRPEFDIEAYRLLRPLEASVAAFGGYMSILSHVFVHAYLGVNVHPADLSVLKQNGTPKYTGDRAVAKAINAGETHLRSSTHIMANKVDCGPILMRSTQMEVNLLESAQQNQDRLKVHGDLVIFPRTLEYLAQGRFTRDTETKIIHFDGKPIPFGVKLEDIR